MIYSWSRNLHIGSSDKWMRQIFSLFASLSKLLLGTDITVAEFLLIIENIADLEGGLWATLEYPVDADREKLLLCLTQLTQVMCVCLRYDKSSLRESKCLTQLALACKTFNGRFILFPLMKGQANTTGVVMPRALLGEIGRNMYLECLHICFV
ncbi:hypothetical protein H5410_053340 [Solanum commersonii]|uniref:Uncharacterized protein n=1 Tax=Solanum commersonii TaxID=4109 RepID=A0A9J5X384_SOLCO|nr:hypothetical protein H5410_053340 [Solanum commersonii]